MNAVLEWVKANVFIVVFGVIMIAAAVTLPLFSSKMNKQVKATVSQRVQLLQQLSQLQKGEIVPGHQGLPNEKTLQRYEQIARVLGEDAAAVQSAAIEHNRKGREPIKPVVQRQRLSIFPDAPVEVMDVIPRNFHDALMDAYGTLLQSVNAGMPPEAEALRQELENTRTQFITQDLRKSTDENLTDEEQAQLNEKLSSVRTSLYVESAKQIGLYVGMNTLGVPEWSQTDQPSHGELFTWQWQYWIIEDILSALHQANQGEPSVLNGPVKHITFAQVMNVPAPGASQGNPAGANRPMTEGFAGAGAGLGDMDTPAPAAQGPAGAEANPKAPIQPNYAASITGRVTNPLYDVINVQLSLVVDTRRIPQVLDAIAKYNFMTVTTLSLRSVDPYAAAQSGFFYGSEPVAEIDMTVETVWLRAWTREFMPVDIKRTLSIPVQAAPTAATPTMPQTDL
jgi:hypothetical protein